MAAPASEIEIHSTLDPKVVNKIAMYIFGLWIDFALGKIALGGRKIMYPTGRYAASIQYKMEGNAIVGIYADESIAKEAGILEKGHGPYDLKTRLGPGRYPIHGFRFGGGMTPVGRIGASGRPTLLKRFMWARMRNSTFSGFASIGPESDPDSWIVPAMPAYAPAEILGKQMEALLRKAGG